MITQDSIAVEGVIGVYTPEGYQNAVSSTNGTVFWPTGENVGGREIAQARAW